VFFLKTIAITGASGYLGVNLISALLRDGSFRVKVLSRTGALHHAFPSHGTLELVKGDLLSPESLHGFLESGCIVVNLVYLWGAGEGANIAAMSNLVQACKNTGISRLVHVSTAAVAGRTDAELVDEDTVCKPISEYGITKLKVETLFREASQGEFDLVMLRPTSVFGPGAEPLRKLVADLREQNWVLNYFKSCLFGLRRMNLVHIDNVTAAVTFLANREKNFCGEVFIVSEDDSDTNNFRYVESALMSGLGLRGYLFSPLRLPLVLLRSLLLLLGRNNINPYCNYSGQKLKKLGFHPPVSFQKGLADYIVSISTTLETQKTPLRVLNVISSIGLESGGGTAERTFQMSRFLAQQANVVCTVLSLDIDASTTRIQALLPAHNVALPCLWKRFYLPRGGWSTIQSLVAEADVIHLMGHWSVLNYLVYLAAHRGGKPYVVCPAGALPIFGRSVIIKCLYNFFAGHSIIQNATAWIAVTDSELPHFEQYGVAPAKVLVIPNGVNEADFPLADQQEFLEKHRLPDTPLVLFMGRLNPIKGPDLLLQAFIRVSVQLPALHLVFIGPDGGMSEQLIQMAASAGLEQRVHFLGYVGGVEKSAAYRCARLLVVPSRQEAMSIVAIEAGICGTPVLLTDQCGFGKVKEVDPRLEVTATVDGLELGLMQLLCNANALTEIAPLWKSFVKKHFIWDIVGLEYLNLYKSILKE
jgi:glycosyltransferase involved in cell wall biosynthesis/nucleoside-diphosphate-sugar epimerase